MCVVSCVLYHVCCIVSPLDYEEGDLRIECIETESHTTESHTNESKNVPKEQDCENHKPVVQSDKRFITRNKEVCM